MITKCKSILLVKRAETTECFNGHVYNYFDVYNESGEKLDEYDAINIKGDVRFDLEEGNPRFFSNFFNEGVYYDDLYHVISSSSKHDEEDLPECQRWE